MLSPLAITCAIGILASDGLPPWPQWGGPGRDFRCEDSRVGEDWSGKRVRPLWSRAIGSGHSSLGVGPRAVFACWGKNDREHVGAFDPSTGDLIWERDHRVEYTSPSNRGPHATPALAGDLLWHERLRQLAVDNVAFATADPRARSGSDAGVVALMFVRGGERSDEPYRAPAR